MVYGTPLMILPRLESSMSQVRGQAQQHCKDTFRMLLLNKTWPHPRPQRFCKRKKLWIEPVVNCQLPFLLLKTEFCTVLWFAERRSWSGGPKARLFFSSDMVETHKKTGKPSKIPRKSIKIPLKNLGKSIKEPRKSYHRGPSSSPWNKDMAIASSWGDDKQHLFHMELLSMKTHSVLKKKNLWNR